MPRGTRLLAFALLPILFAATAAAQGGASNSCDLNADGTVDKTDVDLVINMSLGLVTPCTANIMGSGVCNAVVVQRVITAALGGSCVLSAGSHAVTLTWEASTSANVAGYRVYRGSATGGPYTVLNTALVTATSYLDTAAEAGKAYYYVVTAVDTGNAESSYSNEATAVVPAP